MRRTNEPTFNYKGFDIPLRLAHMTGGADDTFDRISKQHMALAATYIGLRPDMSVVEIGCGIGRDAIPLAETLSEAGCYIGIDVVPDMVAWCQNAITPKHRNFSFYLFDIFEKWYNPTGKLTLSDCGIPAADDSVDFIVLHSVFTHMLEKDILFYMREFKRILKKDGKVLATFFIVDDYILKTQGSQSYITFTHNIAEDCYVHEIEQPTHAIAYLQRKINAMAAEAGLRQFRQPLLGNWRGTGSPDTGQDCVFLERAI